MRLNFCLYEKNRKSVALSSWSITKIGNRPYHGLGSHLAVFEKITPALVQSTLL